MVDAGEDFVFLLCSERSGSNLITRLLDAHPEVCGPPPSHVIRMFAPNLWRYADLRSEQNWSLLCGDVADCLASQLGVWRSSVSQSDLRRVGRSFADLVAWVYRHEAESNGKRVVVVKENQTARLTPLLLAFFPGARYIFMVRDPRDMALSYKLSSAMPGGVRQGVDLWLRDQRDNLEVYGMLRSTGRIVLTRYEDLLAETESELDRICVFLGLEYSPSMLEFHQHDLTIANAARIGAWRNLARPILQNNAGRYREELSEIEIKFIEQSCAAEMRFFGYHRDHRDAADEPLPLSQLLEEYEAQEVPPSADAITDEEAAVRAARRVIIDRVMSRAR